MSREKQMINDLIEIFDEEYSRRMLITPQNTAEKLTAKGYRKQSEGEWKPYKDYCTEIQIGWICSKCSAVSYDLSNGDTDFCPNCGAKMKGGE